MGEVGAVERNGGHLRRPRHLRNRRWRRQVAEEVGQSYRTDEPRLVRFSRFEIGSLLSPAIMALFGALSVGSLFAAGFVLLSAPRPADHLAVANPAKAGAAPARPAGRGATEPRHPVLEGGALAPAMAAPRTAASFLVARFTVAAGDLRFADGDLPGTRFFLFDPVVSTPGRFRLAPEDPAVAMFPEGRAFEPTGAEDGQFLGDLETEGSENRSTIGKPFAEFRRRVVEQHFRPLQASRTTGDRADEFRRRPVARRYRTVQSSRAIYRDAPGRIGYPRADGP